LRDQEPYLCAGCEAKVGRVVPNPPELETLLMGLMRWRMG
jgi:hypothetical protein